MDYCDLKHHPEDTNGFANVIHGIVIMLLAE